MYVVITPGFTHALVAHLVGCVCWLTSQFDTSLISKKKLKMRLRKRTPGATVGQFHGEVDGSERRFNIVAGHENVAAQTINLFADKSGQVLMGTSFSSLTAAPCSGLAVCGPSHMLPCVRRTGKPFRRSFVIAEDMTATGSAFELQDQRVPPKPNLNYKFLPSTHGTSACSTRCRSVSWSGRVLTLVGVRVPWWLAELPGHLEDELEQLRDEDAAKRTAHTVVVPFCVPCTSQHRAVWCGALQ